MLAWRGVAFAAMAHVVGVSPALGIQPTVKKITQEADGVATYHFKIKIDEAILSKVKARSPTQTSSRDLQFHGHGSGLGEAISRLDVFDLDQRHHTLARRRHRLSGRYRGDSEPDMEPDWRNH
jgi:hypothetical protein